LVSDLLYLNTKLIVDFNSSQKGDYWIIGLGPDYKYAVVSDSKMRSLYILSKTTELDTKLYNEALQKAATKMGVSKLLTTIQSGCNYLNLIR
jgi:apolipoprotein D and lipocalin family protein